MRLRCPKNDCAITIPDELLGTTVRCPACSSLIVVDAQDRDISIEQFKPGDPSVTPESEAAKKEAPDLENRIYDGLPPLSVMIALRKRQGSNYDAEDIGRRYHMTEDDWKALRAFETVLHAVAALRISTVVCGIVFAINVLILFASSDAKMSGMIHPAIQLALLVGMGSSLFVRFRGQLALYRVQFGWMYELLQPVAFLLLLLFGMEVWVYLRPLLDSRTIEPSFLNFVGVFLNGAALLDVTRSALAVNKAQKQVAPPEISHRLSEALRYLA